MYGKNTSTTELINEIEDDIYSILDTYLDTYATQSEINYYNIYGELSIEWDIEFYMDTATTDYAIDGKVYINKLELYFKRVATGFINFRIITYADPSIHGYSYQAWIFNVTWKGYGTENPTKSISRTQGMFRINETNLYITGGNDLSDPLLNELLDLITTKSETANIITFETNGGDPISPLSGYMFIPSLPTPTRDSDKFTGWFYDQELTNRVLPNQLINGNITIYARWVTIDKIPNLENTFTGIGYNDGKNAGLIAGEFIGYEYGYDDGYNRGYEEGKIDGSNKDIEILQENAYNDGYNEGLEMYAYKRGDDYLDYNQAYQLGSIESDNLKQIVIPLVIFTLLSVVIFSAIKIVGGKKE
jgi:uncharacterized repeat protein (TIGR02543 family)